MYRVSILGSPQTDDPRFETFDEANEYAQKESDKVDIGYAVSPEDAPLSVVSTIAYGGILFVQEGAF